MSYRESSTLNQDGLHNDYRLLGLLSVDLIIDYKF